MKTLVVIGIAVAMLGVTMPAMATDETPVAFFALSNVTGETTLQAMTDSQLTSIEGAADFCFVCLNQASVRQRNNASQLNLNFIGADVHQRNRADQNNSARVYQRIN